MNNCNACQLSNYCMNQMQYTGNSTLDDYELLVLTDYPRVEDDISGFALSNKDYQFMWDLLNQINVKYLVTSVVRCLPVDITTRRYRKPLIEEYDNCFKNNLVRELNNHPPKCILMVGQSVVDYMVPGKKVADLREKAITISINGVECRMLATYHPNFILNNDNEQFYDRFVEDIVYAGRHAFRDREPDKYKTLTVTGNQFKRMVDIWCNDQSIEYVSYDTESNGLDPLIPGAKITSFSVAVDDNIGYNIMMYHPELPDITDDDRNMIIESARKLLTTKKVVVHHAKHEHRYCKVCWGFTPNIVDDTMYMAYVLFMSYPGMRYGLKYLAGRFISMPPWEEYTHMFSELFKKMIRYKYLDDSKMKALKEEYSFLELTDNDLQEFWNILKDPNYYIKQADSDNSDVFYWLIPMRHLEKYAGMDAIAPLKLMKVLKPMIESDQGFKKSYELMVKAAEAFANIELQGFRICDLELWTNRYKEEVDKSLSIVRNYKEVIEFEKENDTIYNPNSANQNVEVFFKKMAFPVQGTTSKGLPSISEGNLISLIDTYRHKDPKTEDDEYKLNFLLEFRRYKKLNKVLSTYFIGLQRYMRYNDSYDGIKCRYIPVPEGEKDIHIHPQYTLHGTDTGRLSSQSPSMHTIPTDSECKFMFSPHYKGRGGLLVMADYAACELRVLGSVAEKYFGDTSLADAFREGHDVHKFVASRVFNVPIEEVTPLQRRFSKSISFAVVYGSAVSSVAESTGRTQEEAQKMFDDFYRMFPGVRSYIDAMHNYVSQYGCVRFPSGRVRHLPAVFSSDRSAVAQAMRQSQNSPIQGSASDVAVSAIVEFYRNVREKGLDSKVIGTVHDSIYVDVAPGELFEGIDLLKWSMKTYPEQSLDYLTCPMGVDLELSTSLGTHLSLLEINKLSDNCECLVVEGYDFVCDDVINEIKVAYDVQDKLLSEEEYDTGDVDITAQKGVMSLTTRGKFNLQKHKLLLTKKEEYRR